jgi:hypothetical protein
VSEVGKMKKKQQKMPKRRKVDTKPRKKGYDELHALKEGQKK